ncbi:MAG: hypothetical protein K8E66_13115 [Phycisphaerales bacterium]|nr:hypothetical protein [Phycisphaerales bacterium]
MHRASAAVITATLACTLSGCERSPSRADQFREEMRLNGSLFGDGVAEFLRSGDDRAPLSAVADEFDNLYFDGDSRFAQISVWTTMAGKPAISVQMASDAPDGFARTIALRGEQLPRDVGVGFDATGITIAVTPRDGERQTHRADWAPGTIPPYGSIDFDKGEAEINP